MRGPDGDDDDISTGILEGVDADLAQVLLREIVKNGNGTRKDRRGSKKAADELALQRANSTLFTGRPLEKHSRDRLEPGDVIDDCFDPGHVFRSDAQRTALPLV